MGCPDRLRPGGARGVQPVNAANRRAKRDRERGREGERKKEERTERREEETQTDRNGDDKPAYKVEQRLNVYTGDDTETNDEYNWTLACVKLCANLG